MKKTLSILILLLTIQSVYGQHGLLIKKSIVGTFHGSNKLINGLSFGFASTMADDRNVKTNGLRLEIPGIGFLSFMGNRFPNATSPFELNNYSYSEVINGINISTGSWCDCNYNGLTISLVGQYGKWLLISGWLEYN